VGIGLIVILLILRNLKGDFKDDNGGKFDLTGSTVFSAMLLSLMYGMSKLPTQAAWLPIGLGIILLGVFIYVEDNVENPVLDLDIFRTNRAYSLFNLSAMINFSATFSLTFLLSMYLQYIKGLDPQQAGAILIASPIIQAIVSPIAGRLSDRVQPAKLSTAGMAITGLALAPLIFLNFNTSTWYITVALLVLGVGLALFSSPNTNAIMGSVPRNLLGVASSTVGTMRLTGQMFSQGIAMTMIALNMGSAKIVPELHGELLISINGTFTVFFALCILGALASYIGSKVDPSNRKGV
jgi:nitrate/nitrite transporter NarK